MKPVPVPIGVAEISGGFLVSLPRQFWLVVGLRKTFPRLQAAAAPWTYLVPAGRDVAARIEAWIAEVELQVRAEARRRAWTATDAEWNGAGEPEAPRPVAAEPAIIVLPRKRTAKPVLQLLADLTAGAVLVVTVSDDGARGYRLAPSGRRIRTAVAERAIALRLIVPGNDGLFGPEWSQTWRAPTPQEVAAATPKKARKKAARPARARRSTPQPQEARP
ncbi:hypothetical protein SAMN02799622_00916 [Methylobacterium sp. UNC378MF]|uniref:hypothetical protein n=1 Tax=Methylobacterium sp. UNC378MF TaxID=1502748 RepID=UPI00089173CB|nr:hypothetical protein [Methylobacterium sp. UNC378MF]SDA13124.1 hypothetical protein SAMN02799622_00916 [Methylobacterium sp. UNC378MF]